MSGPGFISVEAKDTCQQCNKVAETRPYGKNGERICFECGMLDVETTKRQASRYIFGETIN